MHIAERLYMCGYISYPRTETSAYPSTFDLKDALKNLKGLGEWDGIINSLLEKGFSRPTGGKDAGDHPPITPMKIAIEGEITGDTWRLYRFIVGWFLATLLPNAKYLKTDVKLSIGSESFTLTGSKMLEKGFLDVFSSSLSDEEEEEEVYLPDLKQGQKLELVDVAMKEGQTTPPGYLTESDLIQKMEKLGIGTDASMAVHIANIVNRRYVNVASGRMLIPTPLGIILIHGLEKIDSDLSSPLLRSYMEKHITEIALGKRKSEKVLTEQIELFKSKFEKFIERIARMDELFEVSFSKVEDSGRIFSKCGKCRRYMLFMALKYSFLSL